MAASMANRELLRKAVRLRIPEQLSATGFIQVRYRQKQNVRYRDPHESTKTANRQWMAKKQVLVSKPKDTRGTDNPVWKAKTPTDDVWIRLYYPKQSLPLEEIITRHREYAVPEILDSEDSLIYADMTLNMTTAKKTKFVSTLRNVAHISHGFDDQQQKRCIVFTENPDLQSRALELGAVDAGGKDLIQRLLEEKLLLDEFEFALCTPEVLTQLLPVRTMLKDRFPLKQKGNLSIDVEGMMLRFGRGISYKSQKVSNEISRLQVPFGQLNMPMEHLVENFREIVESVQLHRPVNLGPMISKTQIVCPPSEERFTLQLHNYVPGYEEKQPIKALVQEEEPIIEQDSDDETSVAAKS